MQLLAQISSVPVLQSHTRRRAAPQGRRRPRTREQRAGGRGRRLSRRPGARRHARGRRGGAAAAGAAVGARQGRRRGRPGPRHRAGGASQRRPAGAPPRTQGKDWAGPFAGARPGSVWGRRRTARAPLPDPDPRHSWAGVRGGGQPSGAARRCVAQPYMWRSPTGGVTLQMPQPYPNAAKRRVAPQVLPPAAARPPGDPALTAAVTAIVTAALAPPGPERAGDAGAAEAAQPPDPTAVRAGRGAVPGKGRGAGTLWAKRPARWVHRTQLVRSHRCALYKGWGPCITRMHLNLDKRECICSAHA